MYQFYFSIIIKKAVFLLDELRIKSELKISIALPLILFNQIEFCAFSGYPRRNIVFIFKLYKESR